MVGQDFRKHDYSSGYPLSVMPVTVLVLTGFPPEWAKRAWLRGLSSCQWRNISIALRMPGAGVLSVTVLISSATNSTSRLLLKSTSRF